MADYQFIPIQKDMIPYRFDIILNGKTFTFDVKYNAMSDFFTVDLLRNDQYIVIGEKIVYGRTLFLNQRHLDVPDIAIVPYDLSLNEYDVTWDNLNNTVFLWILQGGLSDG